MTSVPATAFVTGGSGFIGGRLIERLAREGCEVRALARSDGSAAAVEARGATAVRGDLADQETIAAGAAGCETAFHLAAYVKDFGPIAEFVEGNVKGTKRALAGCREAGVRRFVHCGTEAAIVVGQPLVHVDESAPLRPDSPMPYCWTKAVAEGAVITANEPGSFETVAIRPRAVWGAGDTTILPQVEAAVRKGQFAWIGGGRHRTSTTHVDNVVEGLLLGAEKGRPGEAYFVTDGIDREARDFITSLLETRGLEPGEREIPVKLARRLAGIAEAAWTRLPLPGDPPLTRFAVWGVGAECTIDISKARGVLGYEPVTSVEEGLAEMRAAPAT
jgi:nucleoside-diphosphate-sugar epimerase